MTFVASILARSACALIVLVGLLAPGPAQAHEGNPNYRSEIRALEPPLPGVEVEVLNFDDRLLLTNRSGREVRVRGYEGEPYVRILGDGTVEVNKRSPTHYLNEDRFAQIDVPRDASEKASPRWAVVGKSGRYEWHDHRIHWMSKDRPPQVTDEDKPARIFNWKVPIEVGSRRAQLAGTLRWEPNDSSAPVAAYVALGAIAIASALLMWASRRIRRRRTATSRGEAWG